MKHRAHRSLFVSAALCTALLAGCGKEETKAGASVGSAKESVPPSTTTPAAPATKPAATSNVITKESIAAQQQKSGDAPGTGTAETLAEAEAALDKLATQEELDAAAAKQISSANAEAEFKKLAEEIEKEEP